MKAFLKKLIYLFYKNVNYMCVFKVMSIQRMRNEWDSLMALLDGCI